MRKLAVGQELWYVPNSLRWNSPCSVTVVSVGRKWAAISNRARIDMETMMVDGKGYSSPGTCYLSREEYEAELALKASWAKLARQIDKHRRSIPSAVTMESITQVRSILGLAEESV